MTAQKKVLIVDDALSNRKLMEALLSEDGYLARSAGSGLEALKEIAAERPDAVLLDLIMPGMDGFEVVRRMKADPVARTIPIVMVTGLSDAGSLARLAEAGVTKVVVKPLDRWDLKQRLAEIWQEEGGEGENDPY